MKNLSDKEQAFFDKLRNYKSDEENASELIRALESSVNNFGFDQESLISAIKTDKKGYQNLVRTAYEWVIIWAEAEDWRVDGRNEYAVKLCKDIYPFIRDTTLRMSEIKNYAYAMHKTLVQTATAMFVTVLAKENETIAKYTSEKFGKSIRLPFI